MKIKLISLLMTIVVLIGIVALFNIIKDTNENDEFGHKEGIRYDGLTLELSGCLGAKPTIYYELKDKDIYTYDLSHISIIKGGNKQDVTK